MRTQYSFQYDAPAVIPDGVTDAGRVMALCRDAGALYFEDPESEPCYIVIIRPDIGPELWTERALRGSLKQSGNKL